MGISSRSIKPSATLRRRSPLRGTHPAVLALTLVLVGTPTAIAQMPAPSTPNPATFAPGEDGYLLGPGDRVRVDFFNVPEYTGEYLVLPNGTVNFPEVGPVAVQGRTLQQAAAAVSERFSGLLQRPIVTVSLLGARPVSVAIAGEVSRPGTYTLAAATAASDGSVPTVTRIIQLSGGVTQAANVRQVQVRRQRPASAGGDEVLTVDLWALASTGDINQDLQLQDGDSIFIPATDNTNLAEARQLAATSFAATNAGPMQVAVVGEVNRPGTHVLDNRPNSTQVSNATRLPIPTVTQAIQEAGGITQSANIRNIQVKRLTRSGGEQLITVNFWDLLSSGDLQQDLPLQEGDTIVVPTATALSPQEAAELASASFSPNEITVNVVGEVVKPGGVTVPPNTPLNQAVLAAGGFNNRRAKKSEVTLVRLNPDGTVSKREIEIDLAAGISDETNPALRNNDTIVVGRSTVASLSDTIGTVLSPLSGVFGLFRLLGL